MPTLVGDVPVFNFFRTYPFGLDADTGVQPSRDVIGSLSSMRDVDALVPAAFWRVEIEREAGIEEVRVVNSRTGQYHVAKGAAAQLLITELNQRTAEVFKGDGVPFPAGMDDGEKRNPFYTSIIQYDHEAYRTLPAIKYGGEIEDAEFERISDGPGAVYATPEFVGVLDTRTGIVWKASDGLARRILDSERDCKEDAACGEDAS